MTPTTDSSTPTGPLPQSRDRWLVPFFVLLVTAAVFLPALNFGFVCDDSQQIVLNQARFTWHAIPSYFTTDVWSYILLVRSNYYRPIFMIWLMLNYQLFGLNTFLWHAGALLAHLAATFLVYLLALRLTGKRLAAGAAALLFGVHPVHVEAVDWLSGSTETVFATLALGTILCHLQRRDPSSARSRLWRAAEFVLFTLAMFAKETAIVLPVLLLAWELLLPAAPSASARNRVRVAIASILPHLYIVSVYFLARYHALKGFSPLLRNWPLRSMIATWPLTLAFYLRQLLFPFQFSLFYPIQPVAHFSISRLLLPSLLVLAAAGALFWICRRGPQLSACALLLVLPILPVLYLRAFAFDDFLHDRYAYLPSVGLCILAAMGLEKLPLRRAARALLLAAAVVGLAAASVWTGRFWSDNLALYTRAIEVAPDNTIAQEYLAEELVEEERWADALPLLTKALVQDPTAYDLYIWMAKCHVGLGDPDEAMSYFGDAIALSPFDPEAYLDVAVVEFNQNLLPQAEQHMRQALLLRRAFSPLYSQYHFRLARILEREEKWPEAAAEYQAELRENPSFDDALSGLDRVRGHIGAIQ